MLANKPNGEFIVSLVYFYITRWLNGNPLYLRCWRNISLLNEIIKIHNCDQCECKECNQGDERLGEGFSIFVFMRLISKLEIILWNIKSRKYHHLFVFSSGKLHTLYFYASSVFMRQFAREKFGKRANLLLFCRRITEW